MNLEFKPFRLDAIYNLPWVYGLLDSLLSLLYSDRYPMATCNRSFLALTF